MYPEEGKPGDSILVDQMFFNNDGLCISEITLDYSSKYHYDVKGQKIKDVYKGINKEDESVIIFKYDEKGNMIFSEKIKASKDEPLGEVYFKHQFTYNTDNEVLRDTWLNRNGEIQTTEKREYLPAELDSGVIKVIRYYDINGHPDRIQKKYANGRIVMYNIGVTKNTVRYEQFLDDNKKVVKVIDYRHMGPHAADQVKEFGHGIILFTTVTELYKYNAYGLCSEKLTYQSGILIEKQTWHYLK